MVSGLILPAINPVAVTIGPVAIYWYALTWLVGAFGTWGVIASRLRSHWGWGRNQGFDLVSYCLLGAMLGGRLGYVLFYGLGMISQDASWALRIWEGGMSFHGGVIGVAGALIFFARRMQVSMLTLADEVCLGVPVALGLVRVGNFINGELWGRVTEVPWAVVFANDPHGLPRHPSQLYEAVLEGPVLLLCLLWASRRGYRPGTLAVLFFAGYALARILVELFRAPDAHIGFDFFGVVTRGQWLSLLLLLAAALVYRLLVLRQPRG